MAYSVSNDYKNEIYSGDTQNQLKLLFNNVELEDADLYCEKLTVKSRIVPNGAKSFSLNNFISKEAELILHDVDLDTIQNQVTISIGTLVNNSYEYVPIGIFNIEDQPTTDKNKTTIKLRDNSVKFDFNYNAQPLIEENGGSATKLQILQDICTQAGVTCNITSFIGYLDKIGVYDNTITGRQYIANIAEQAGKIATINRSGELIFLDLNNLTTWDIPIEIVEKYENGTTYKIGKVVYEDGIVRYETPDSNDDTLFLDASNSYINGELTKEQANSTTNTFELSNTSENDLVDLTIDGKATQETRTGKNLLQNIATTQTLNDMQFKINNDGSITLNGTASDLSYVLLSNILTLNGTYTLSGGSNLGMYVYMRGLNIDNGYSVDIQTHPNTYGTATLNGRYIFYIYVSSGTSLNNAKVYPQLELGSTPTPFEEYDKQPSPDFPSEIVNVGYQNIFNKGAAYIHSGGHKTEIDTGVRITQSIAGTYKYSAMEIGRDELLGKTLTISANVNPSASNIGGIFLFWGNSNSVSLQSITGMSVTGEAVITKLIPDTMYTGADRINILLYVNTTGTGVVDNYTDFENLQIEISDKKHSYIPFGKYGIEVKNTNKNLFNLGVKEETLYDLTSNINYSEIIFDGTKTANSNTISKTSIGIFKAGTYTFSFSKKSGSYTNISDEFTLYAGTTKVVIISLNRDTYTNSFTINNDTEIFIQYWVNSGSSYSNYDVLFQLEKGNATEYEPYKANIQLYTLDNPLRANGNVKDKLYIENGTLKVERNIRHFELPISEMNNSEDYPGWTNRTETTQMKSDYPNENTFLDYVCDYNCNIGVSSEHKVSINTNGNGIIFLLKGYNNNLTQAQWKTNYPNLVVDFDYVMPETEIEIVGDVTMPTTYNENTYIDIGSNINTNIHIEYKQNTTQLEAILNEVNEFSIESFKTGKILGNPAIDPYDLIHIHEISKNLYVNSQVFSGAWQNSSCWETATETFNNCVIKKRNGAWQGIYKAYTVTEGKTYTFSLYGKADNKKQCAIYLTPNGMSDVTTPIAKYNVYLQPYWQRFYITFVATATGYIAPRIEAGTANDDYIYIACYQLEESEYTTDYEPYYDKEFTTLATNELTYTGVITNTFDTQIGEEQKEQNVTVNGEATFKKWATTKIDNVEGQITLQAGEIDDTNGRIDSTEFTISKQGALLNVISTNSDININYDESGNPLSGEITAVKTKQKGFTFNDEGLTISAGENDFKSVSDETGTYYYDGANPVGEYTKDGSKQQNLTLFGAYKYGMDDYGDTPMFVAQLYTDNTVTPAEQGVGHFYNGDLNNGGGE